MFAAILKWSNQRCAEQATRFARRWSEGLAVPIYFLELLILLEDKRFPGHFGIDPIGIFRAIRFNLRTSNRRQGASTLAQQLYNVRMAGASGGGYSRSLGAKLIQILFGLWISLRLSKVAILSEYLESVYWGHDFRGLDAAATGYFGKRRCELSFEESFLLVERLACPNRLSSERIAVIVRRPSITSLIAVNRSSALDIISLYDRFYMCGNTFFTVIGRDATSLLVARSI
jgi:membrane peptidoglycan carboxypeptidase